MDATIAFEIATAKADFFNIFERFITLPLR
jgi:hypothetical protein